jgi:putative tryptophan/tyrosine transport system substrate-binding protein
MSSFFVELGAKSVELLKQLIPSAAVIAYLVNPSSPHEAEFFTKEAAAAARTLGIQVPVPSASTEHNLDQVYAALGKLKADGLVVTANSIFLTNRDKFVGLSARAVVPTIYPFREFTVAGGLVSCGASLPDAYRQASGDRLDVCHRGQSRHATYCADWSRCEPAAVVRRSGASSRSRFLPPRP